jgi:hypothetical protein
MNEKENENEEELILTEEDEAGIAYSFHAEAYNFLRQMLLRLSISMLIWLIILGVCLLIISNKYIIALLYGLNLITSLLIIFHVVLINHHLIHAISYLKELL